MPSRFTSLVSLLLIFALIASAAIQRPSTKTEIDTLNAADEVLKNVSRLRGLAVKQPVRRGLKTRDEIEREVMRDLDESNSPEEIAAASKTLTKLGLISKGFDLRDCYVKLLREQVAGFYRPRTQEFYLAAWIPISEQKIVIAHELVHALQDQHFNLRRFEKWPRGDSDAEIAAHALIEGDATVVMYKYALDEQGRQINSTMMTALIEMLMNDSEPTDATKYPALARAPAVLRENLQFPYSYGAAFVHSILKNRSLDELNNAYNRLPASTEQIIHPDRYLLFDHPVKIDLSDLVGALGQDWSRVDLDTSGEFGFQVILGEFVGKRRARLAAEGWDGDRYALYENKQGELLLTMMTTWDSKRDAEEFFDAYTERTQMRYERAVPSELTATRRVYYTSERIVAIEMRGMDVVVVEGAAGREQMEKLLRGLWESKKHGGQS